MGPMRRNPSTVVVLAGPVPGEVLTALGRSMNVTLIRPDDSAGDGLETAAAALQRAGRATSPYALVPADPLAAVAAAWREMWDVPGSQDGAAGFEASAALALAAWRDRRFDLPDYYLIITPAEADGARADLYLGPLRAVRSRRVAVAGGGVPAQAGQIAAALRSLEHGPWWPPLDEVLDAARRFYPGGLAETQLVTP